MSPGDVPRRVALDAIRCGEVKPLIGKEHNPVRDDYVRSLRNDDML